MESCCSYCKRLGPTLKDCCVKCILLLCYYQLLVEHRPSTISFHVLLSLTIFSNSFQVLPITCTSFSTSLRQVFFRLLFRLAPWGIQERACLIKFVVDFLNVWPIHLHILFCMSCSTGIGICAVLSHTVAFVILSYHLITIILRR